MMDMPIGLMIFTENLFQKNTRDWYLFHMGQQIVLNDSLYEQIATIAEQDEMLSYNFFMCTGSPILSYISKCEHAAFAIKLVAI